MRTFFAAALLLFLIANTVARIAAPAWAQPSTSIPSGAFTPMDGGVQAAPTLLLPLQSARPFACSSIVDGAIAQTHRHRLCVCNGNQWIFESTGEACTW
jgi:hypothetical protein